MKQQLSILKSACLNAYFRIYIALVPFPQVRRQMASTGLPHAPRFTALWVGRVVTTSARYVPLTTCLSRALAAQFLLRTKGYGSQLQVGVANGDSPGSLLAHAWLISGDVVVVGNENNELTKFKILTDMSEG